MIAVVTDSNAQLPPALADRYGIRVVPITVVVDGRSYLEGVDLDADLFYRSFEGGHVPEVSTAAPSPGRFLSLYRELADSGCEEIVSVHVGAALSGTLNSAAVAAKRSPVPVHLVDTKVASFGIACAAWSAADAIEGGATALEAIAAAEELLPRIGNVFIVQALDLARAGGRLAVDASGIAVLSYVDEELEVLAEARSAEEAVEAMAAPILAAPGPLRVAVGVADRAAAPLWEALEARVGQHPDLAEVIRYRVGPSVGVHTGPGTAGAFWYRV